MSFASPVWLAALALVPIALVLSLRSRRRAGRYAIRFPAVATLALAAGSAPAWRRRLPTALALAAIAVLALALARPHVSYRAPVQHASIMLVTDHSGSMAAGDVQPSRLAAAQRAADSFIAALPSSALIGAVAFGSSADAVQGPVANHAAARAIIDGQSATGATATGDALELALQLLRGQSAKHPPSAVVLLSDGSANTGADPVAVARQAAQDRIPIYTVALGTPGGVLQNPDPFGPPVPVPPDPRLMVQIAEVSRGRAFNAQSADELSSIYGHLGSQLGSVKRTREVSYEFVIAAVALLLAAGVGSTRWLGRLP